MRHVIAGLIGAALCGSGAIPATAQTDQGQSQGATMIVLDGSGSMWGQIDGTTKIEIAREAIGRMLADWPEGRAVGLMAYGHRREGDCEDIETLMAPAALDRAGLEQAMASVTPRGKTPVGASVRAAADALGETPNASVIVVTDGLENCGADLCALGEALADEGAGLKTHVVGFDIAEGTDQLACLAEASGGRYLPASDADSLNDALRQVSEPPPEPEPAGPLMRDEFERADLGDAWTVDPASPQHFILEGGQLITMTAQPGNIDNADQPNVFRWTGAELPDGDWTIAADFTAELGVVKTLGGRKAVIEVGRFQDAENHVVARLYRQGNSNDDMHLEITSMAGGTPTSDSVEIAGDIRGYDLARILRDFEEKGARLALTKRGREYSARLEMKGWAMTDGGPEVIETAPVQMLRSSGDPAVFAGTGHSYRLPSEAEWEYAARAGTETMRFWGDDRAHTEGCAYLNASDEALAAAFDLPVSSGAFWTCQDGQVYTAAVGTYAVNRFGVSDMLGNVWEWTADCFFDDHLGAPADGSARLGEDCEGRVLRGGSWLDRAFEVRAAIRPYQVLLERSDIIGFRVARDLP